jgi:CheY-like chemotaxis protein
MRVNAIQLQQQALELRSHDQRKNEFLGLLGHELRNPLAAMISSLQALTAMEPGDQRQTPLLTMLKSQCRHMAHLVDDLLDVSRISTGKIMLRRLPHLLQDTVTASVEAITPQLDDRQHRFTLDLPPQPVWLNADPVRLRQIISNLLSNAVKYTETGGELTLSVQHDGGAEVSISIRDNGIGIANDALVNIFEPFTQVQQTQEQFQDGLGLGLALVKKLVELHDGTVSAHSEGPGQGCEIKVQLPVLEAPPLQQSKTDSVQAAPVIPQRILLIDDNVNITSALEILLQMSGHEVRVCNQSREALAVAREFHPDVALVDIAMPDMDGLQVAQQLRTELAQQPMKLIAVTGYGTEDDIHNIRDAGFDAHLLKPVELPELNLAIAKVLSGPRTDGSSG